MKRLRPLFGHPVHDGHQPNNHTGNRKVINTDCTEIKGNEKTYLYEWLK